MEAFSPSEAVADAKQSRVRESNDVSRVGLLNYLPFAG